MSVSRSLQQDNHRVGEKFLYDFKAGPAGGLRPPSGRRRHGGHRGAGLTLQPWGPERLGPCNRRRM
jgi:hypothetical protein